MPLSYRSTLVAPLAGALLISCTPPQPALAPSEPAHARASAAPPTPSAEPAQPIAPAAPASADARSTSSPAAAPSTPAQPPVRSSATKEPIDTPWTECRIDPLPASIAPPPPRACVKIAPGLEKALRPKLSKPYEPPTTGASVVVSFACDPLEKTREVVVELGSGHGQNLTLIRLRPRGRSLSALRITRPGMYSRAARPALIERAEIDGGALEAHMPELRALALATLTERIPPDAHDISESFSSNDWHGLLRIEDEAGRSLERSFTGYQSSTAQLSTIPMVQIDAILDPILEAIPWQDAPADADARAFFVARFLAAGPERADWWVKERFVMLSEQLGTPALVPKLVELALATGRDASVERTRVSAVDALAALAGFDARLDSRGARVPVDAAAAAYRRSCGAPAR